MLDYHHLLRTQAAKSARAVASPLSKALDTMKRWKITARPPW